MEGLGVLLQWFAGGSEHDASEYYGRKIKDAQFKKGKPGTINEAGEEDKIILAFEDGVTIKIFDNGRACCEARYMTTDDDITRLIGKTLTGITVKDATDRSVEWVENELCFLEIMTDDGLPVTFATHNEHNGYYGGFGLTIVEGE